MKHVALRKGFAGWKKIWQYTHHKLELLQVSLVQLRVLFLLCFLSGWQVGCSAIGKMFVPAPTVGERVGLVAQEVSGIATLAGIAALVITRGGMGMRAIVIGVILIVLNFAVANYMSWILVPVLVATGLISLAWSYKTMKELLDR